MKWCVRSRPNYVKKEHVWALAQSTPSGKIIERALILTTSIFTRTLLATRGYMLFSNGYNGYNGG